MADRPAESAPCRREAGFTLLEAMVAFVIVAVVLGAAYASMAASHRGAARADAALGGLARAEAAMARIGADLALVPGERLIEAGAWSVAISIERAAAGARTATPLGLGLYRVSVTASGGPDTAAITLETLRIGPP